MHVNGPLSASNSSIAVNVKWDKKDISIERLKSHRSQIHGCYPSTGVPPSTSGGRPYNNNKKPVMKERTDVMKSEEVLSRA